MSASTSRRAGFSLLELLVVVGTIALLIAILLPVAAHVRAASRSTKCLANLQQWGQSFQMYLSVNRGHAPPILDGNDHRHFEWWETLAPFHSNVAKTLLCPEADGPRQPPPKDYLRGSAHTAWVVGRHRDGALGSYGFNVWLYATPTGFKAQYFQFPVSQPDRIPLLGDCCEFRPASSDGNEVPDDLENPGHPRNSNGLTDYCIDRHNMAVNVVFVDGHAEHVQLADLWKLKWSQTFHARDVTVPAL